MVMLLHPQPQDPNHDAQPVEFAYATRDAPENQTRRPPGSNSEGKKQSRLLVAFYDLWHSVFDWDYIMLIVVPKPNFGIVNDRCGQKAVTHSQGLFTRLTHLLSAVVRFLNFSVAKAFAAIRIPFLSSSKLEPLPLIPRFLTPKPTGGLGSSNATTSMPSPYNTSNSIVTVPSRAVPRHHVPVGAEIPRPAGGNHDPATAQFITTLVDLEEQIQNHRLYDLERELDEMDNRMANLFDFPWMIGVPEPQSPALKPNREDPRAVPMSTNLPQAPSPARRDGKTVQILPLIMEVSENSPDLTHSPPYDPTGWSIVNFQPLWGPRTQVGAAR